MDESGNHEFVLDIDEAQIKMNIINTKAIRQRVNT